MSKVKRVESFDGRDREERTYISYGVDGVEDVDGTDEFWEDVDG